MSVGKGWEGGRQRVKRVSHVSCPVSMWEPCTVRSNASWVMVTWGPLCKQTEPEIRPTLRIAKNNPYHFFLAKKQKAITKAYSLNQCDPTVNWCAWHIVAGNDDKIGLRYLTRGDNTHWGVHRNISGRDIDKKNYKIGLQWYRRTTFNEGRQYSVFIVRTISKLATLCLIIVWGLSATLCYEHA